MHRPGRLVEPEFVAHLFAPLQEPDSVAALHRFWTACRDTGRTRPLRGTVLPATLPPGVVTGPDRALAIMEDDAGEFQVIARLEQDTFNVSFGASAGRDSWLRFGRLFRLLGGEAPELGGATLLLAKSDDALTVDLRAEVPPRADDADGWWENWSTRHRFVLWETTPPGTTAPRRLVLLAGLRQDAALSRFAWSDGGTGLPPLGRELLQEVRARRRPEVVRSEPDGPVHRVAFGVDVVSYSSRSTPQQLEVQRRVAAVADRVLAGLGLDLKATDSQFAGDGMMVVLPAHVRADVALPRLLHGWRAQTSADNAEHPGERIRMRLSAGSGPFTRAHLGFGGNTIIGLGRLLDSAALRQAMVDHPDADVVAIVTDRIFQDVVAEGYPGLTTDEFRSVEAGAKTFRATAWLWTGDGAV
ncbi:hypothetical protein JIG36_10585 [Actinoplanes sp. LDG1-06]|uniref:CASPASE and TPR Repeat-Associated N-terminal domain-containing protein n=1 Tax=Paractinoplanes ovalisporus TaxID=2810368 RepID=A0ABS2A844_9ACTN|nr:CATRA conflict system CASPASE/TPR repeat-associated protein [Actinoplanes ovalisporus]MBM2616002.1 hypothetical protein [Actinoplanes ovalisporus]